MLWVEVIFAVTNLVLLLNLPFPPYRDAFGFTILVGGAVWAGVAAWLLGASKRGAWVVAVTLALAWVLWFVKNSYAGVVIVFSYFTGRAAVLGHGALFLLGYLVSLSTVAMQGLILVAWWRVSRQRR